MSQNEERPRAGRSPRAQHPRSGAHEGGEHQRSGVTQAGPVRFNVAQRRK
jgi:hypothetical protein